jgi:hypothetical protein
VKDEERARELLDALDGYEWPQTRIGVATEMVKKIRAELSADPEIDEGASRVAKRVAAAFDRRLEQVRADRDAEWSTAWLEFVKSIGASTPVPLSVPSDLAPYLLMHKEHEAERDAELQRAMAVVEAVLRYNDRGSCCEFDGCPGNQYVDGQDIPHNQGCPLVANGFITPEGASK